MRLHTARCSRGLAIGLSYGGLIAGSPQCEAEIAKSVNSLQVSGLILLRLDLRESLSAPLVMCAIQDAASLAFPNFRTKLISSGTEASGVLLTVLDGYRRCVGKVNVDSDTPPGIPRSPTHQETRHFRILLRFYYFRVAENLPKARQC